MKNYIILTLFIFISIHVQSQVPTGEELVGLHAVPTSDLGNVTSPIIGSILYNPTDEKVYVYTASGWKTYESSTTGTYVGQFIITSTGNINITGLPFQPSSVTFVAHANVETLNLDSSGSNINNKDNSFGTTNGFARDNNGSITQQFIYLGGSGESINNISRYSSSSNCIGLRYSNQDGNPFGRTLASLTSFNSDGFTINVSSQLANENVVVLYTAYK